MELELIFENKLGIVQYDREKAVLRGTYQGIASVDLGIENFQAVLNVIDKYPLRGAIFDCTKMKGSFTQLNPWFKEVWYPAAIPQGYICWALVSTDVFTRFAGTILINKMSPPEITAKIFGSPDKAEKWTYDFLEKH